MKKKRVMWQEHNFLPLRTLLKVMKLTAFLILLGTMSVSASGFGQEAKVSLSLNGEKLTTFFKVIEKQTNYRFAYSNDIIPEGRIVKINVKDESVDKVMSNVMATTPLKYRFDKKSGIIIISEKENTTVLPVQKVQKTITGTVMNEQGAPLAGVTVTEKGTTNVTMTNENGIFSIDVDNNAQVLIFSFVGMVTKEVSIAGEKNLQVVLSQANQSLNEIVVVGYGTQNRGKVTGAVASVTGKTINEMPAASVAQALQGRVSGVTVTNNGYPGSAPIVRVRGISSISFASDPLYIIDGVPTENLEAIDTKDIESVDVLKDASAAAIYGSRATNGVIMITTRKGRKDGGIKVNYDGFVGTQNVTKRLDLLDLEGFKKYAVAYNGAQVPRLLDPWVNTPIYQGASQTYGQTNTNWQDEYFRSGMMTGHNVNLSGGTEKSRFYSSLGYFNQRGTVPVVGYKRYNFRINSEHNISKVFTFGQNLYMAYGDRDFIDGDNESGSRTNLVNVIRMMPHIPVYDPTSNGGFRGVNSALDGGDPTNPLEDAILKLPGNKGTTKIFGNAFLDIALAKSLKFKSTFGIDHVNMHDFRFSPIFNDNGTIAGSSASVATVTNNRFLSTMKLFTQQLTFDENFGNHHLNATAVYEVQTQKTKQENAKGQQESNELKTLNNASNVSVKTITGENTLISYLGRINYDYLGKYLLSASVRRDGLSVWAPGKKWATFPSASLGWRISKENFMMNHTSISDLKLRAGYGVTGLNGVVLGNTPWLVSVNANSSSYPFGNNISGGPASSIPGLGNKDLEWEKTKQMNIGLDLGLWANKLTFSIDYFDRKTDNLILNVPLPPSMGYMNREVVQNVGGMKNSGLEMQLGYNENDGEFTWFANANLSIIKNKVTKLAEGVTNIEAGGDADFGSYNITNTVVGQPIQSFYGWNVLGLFQSAQQVSSSPKQTDATAAGDIKFEDTDKNNIIDVNDRQFLGSFLPKLTYGANLGANYKNFDLTAYFQGVQGNKIFNATKVITEGMIRFFNAGTQVLNAWTPSNTNTNIPRAVSSDPNGNARPSTRFIEDGSYLRLKNIMLGYTIPEKSLGNITNGVVKQFRVFVSAQNILTFTKYSGYDPEVGNRTPGSSLTNGIDFAVYPQPKAYQLGVQVGF
ncbi:MAG: TonB-dependent receptor [Niabella sp.]|nr:MAG: TonB-dependent receptor [Niabella sp.]